MKWDSGLWEAVPATLAQFLDWAFTGRIVATAPRGSSSGWSGRPRAISGRSANTSPS